MLNKLSAAFKERSRYRKDSAGGWWGGHQRVTGDTAEPQQQDKKKQEKKSRLWWRFKQSSWRVFLRLGFCLLVRWSFSAPQHRLTG